MLPLERCLAMQKFRSSSIAGRAGWFNSRILWPIGFTERMPEMMLRFMRACCLRSTLTTVSCMEQFISFATIATARARRVLLEANLTVNHFACI